VVVHYQCTASLYEHRAYLDGEARGDEHDDQHEDGQLGASHGQSVPQHHDVRVQPHELGGATATTTKYKNKTNTNRRV
jgi:hypothetical protein